MNKAQGMTAETSGILIGGWQTDKEHAYVAVSRAREQTQIFVSREDLGEQGFDTGAMERLAEKIKRSRAQEASITQNVAERAPERPQTTERERHRQQDIDDFLDPHQGRPNDRASEQVSSEQPGQAERDRLQSDARERFAQHEQETNNTPVDIREANPADIQLDVRDLVDIQLVYSTQLYNLQSQPGELTHVLFGGWQTEQQLGFVIAVHAGGETDVRLSTEHRDGRDIQTELQHRIGHAIQRSQTHEATNTRGHHPQSAQAELAESVALQPPATEPLEHDPQIQPEPHQVERDPFIERDPACTRTPASHGTGHRPRSHNDLGLGIE